MSSPRSRPSLMWTPALPLPRPAPAPPSQGEAPAWSAARFRATLSQWPWRPAQAHLAFLTRDSLEQMVRRVTQPHEDEDAAHRSIGISNVFRRLKIAFGEGVMFHAEGAAGEGLRITLRVEGGSGL